MFKPNFRYTDKIVKNLTLISEARAIILNSPLIPKWEVSLRRDALIRSAHSSTAIEGNRLSWQRVGSDTKIDIIADSKYIDPGAIFDMMALTVIYF